MLSGDVEKLYPSAKALVKDCVASRIHAKDASLYDFSEEARACSEQYMGWTDLASNSPYSLRDIQNFADSIIAQGLKTVVLIGQGGSTQAPMTITKYNKPDSSVVTFKTLDSDSPVRVRAILAEAQPETTLFVISSKSGGTIEPRLALQAVRDAVAASGRMSEQELVQHLVGITDPGSMLERQAREEGWAAVFSGQPTVGGRFSALSVFYDRAGYDGVTDLAYYIAPEWQGRGAGTFTLAKLLDECRNRHMRKACGIIFADNAGSIALMHHFGFTQFGLMPAAATDSTGTMRDMSYWYLDL